MTRKDSNRESVDIKRSLCSMSNASTLEDTNHCCSISGTERCDGWNRLIHPSRLALAQRDRKRQETERTKTINKCKYKETERQKQREYKNGIARRFAVS